MDWRRTTLASTHVPTPDGNLTIPDPYRTKNSVHQQDPLTELHRKTCQHIHGWLGLGPDTYDLPPRGAAMAVLRQTEHRVFQDRHRRVHQWLRRFHDQRDGVASSSKQGVSGLVASRFEYVWEFLLRRAFACVDLRIPPGQYERLDGSARSAMRLRPDLVARVGDELWVIDAKHYDVDRLPATESITKQMLYRLLLSQEGGGRNWPLAKIRNVFLLPGVDVPGGLAQVARHTVSGTSLGHIDVLVGDIGLLSRRASAWTGVTPALTWCDGFLEFEGSYNRAPGVLATTG